MIMVITIIQKKKKKERDNQLEKDKEKELEGPRGTQAGLQREQKVTDTRRICWLAPFLWFVTSCHMLLLFEFKGWSLGKESGPLF